MRYSKLKQAGLTLIEIMVVIVIMAILAAIVVPKIMKRPEQAKKAAAKAEIKVISDSMDLYKLDNGFYPSQEQGIQALVTLPNSDPQPKNWNPGGYMNKLPIDPWGHNYLYKNPGDHSEIDIYCLGSSKSIKTIIGNWYEKPKPAE
jgi:general secretion pathway protein G